MNNVVLAGEVVSAPEFSHNAYGEKFYKIFVATKRESGTKDILCCILPEIFVGFYEESKKIEIRGEIRTRNIHDETGNHLEVFVFVTNVCDYEEDKNDVELDGFICKEPTYRETPFGRKITDLIVASNRENFKSDYIPCIAWGRNAIRTSEFNVGTRVKVLGRLQSREYKKKIDDETYEVRTAYELSSYMIDVVEESEETDENSN